MAAEVVKVAPSGPKITLRFFVVAVVLALGLLIIDDFIWEMPRLVYGFGAGSLDSHCRQITPGMGRPEILDLMRGTSSEEYSTAVEFGFYRWRGHVLHTCTISLDDSGRARETKLAAINAPFKE